MLITDLLAGRTLSAKIAACVSVVAVTGAAAGIAGVLPPEAGADVDTGAEMTVEAEASADAGVPDEGGGSGPEVPGDALARIQEELSRGGDGPLDQAPSTDDLTRKAEALGRCVADEADDGGADDAIAEAKARVQGVAERVAEGGPGDVTVPTVPDAGSGDGPGDPPLGASGSLTVKVEAEAGVGVSGQVD